jgi:ABC-type glycerol-3-phosphate transport system permease component
MSRDWNQTIFGRGAKANAKRAEMIKHICIWCVLAVAFLPLYVMFMTSFKNNHEFFTNPWGLPSRLEWSNWVIGWHTIKDLVATTLVVAVSAVVMTMIVALPGAYFFARGYVPLRGFVWFIFMSLLMMPTIANLLPLYALLKSMGMLNSIWTIAILLTAGAQVGTIFWLRGFIEDIPKDLFEAAEIDGASDFYQMTQVTLPLVAPVLATLAVTRFIGAWNEFMLPLILITDPYKQMLSVGLMQLDSQYVKQYGQLMAAYAIASIPLIVLFLFGMKFFIRGLMGGAVKG